MAATLKFTVKDCDRKKEKYQLQNLDVSDCYCRPSSKEIKTVAEAEEMLAKDDVVIFGFGATDSTVMKTFAKTADKLRQEYNFAHTSAEEVMTKLGKKEGVILYRPKHLDSQFEDGSVTYTEGDMATWIIDNKHGIAGHRTSDNVKEFTKVILLFEDY